MGTRCQVPIGAMLALGATLLALPAGAHRLAAAGAGVCSYPPCADTHREGSFQVGVPGVDPDFSYYTSSVDSDSGHMSIAAAFSWIDSKTRPSSFEFLTDVIEENVVLQRIGPGPVVTRATLALAGGGHAGGEGTAVKLIADFSFGCHAYATKIFTTTVATDLELVGNSCAQIVGSALVVTTTYEGNLPSSIQLRAQLQSDYLAVYKGSTADFGWEGDLLQVELQNATATWDTPTFLTLAPEPGAGALAAACCATLILLASAHRAP